MFLNFRPLTWDLDGWSENSFLPTFLSPPSISFLPSFLPPTKHWSTFTVPDVLDSLKRKRDLISVLTELTFPHGEREKKCTSTRLCAAEKCNGRERSRLTVKT